MPARWRAAPCGFGRTDAERHARVGGRCISTSSRPAPTRAGARGQTLVEFALVLPLFMTLMLGLIEFAFLFNSILVVQFAAQNAALVAAEIGDVPGAPGKLPVADCAILQEVERDIAAPADRTQISKVDITWVTAAGVSVGTGTTTTTTYTRSGSSDCDYPGRDLGDDAVRRPVAEQLSTRQPAATSCNPPSLAARRPPGSTMSAVRTSSRCRSPTATSSRRHSAAR